MDSPSAWRVYEKTFSVSRSTNYRKHTYIYAEILSQYLGEACHGATMSRRSVDWPWLSQLPCWSPTITLGRLSPTFPGARDRYQTSSSSQRPLIGNWYRVLVVPDLNDAQPLHLLPKGIAVTPCTASLALGHTNYMSAESYVLYIYTRQNRRAFDQLGAP